MSKAIVKKGEIICCYDCGVVIAEVLREIIPGKRIIASMFNFNYKQTKNDSPMLCPECFAPWFCDGSFHTYQGWKPYKPNIKRAILSWVKIPVKKPKDLGRE